MLFLSTPSARRATRSALRMRQTACISIHALREEGDRSCELVNSGADRFLSTPSARRATARAVLRDGDAHISIHALREEGDLSLLSARFFTSSFLSTPSARRATSVQTFSSSPFWISIHALREEGDLGRPECGRCSSISIHALREEGDMLMNGKNPEPTDFYPRPPRGGRLHHRLTPYLPRHISIHALREEGDQPPAVARGTPPAFLSTPSARRATLPL